MLDRIKRSVKTCRPHAFFSFLLLGLTLLIGISWLVFAPKKTFSENENRILEPLPVPSVSSLLDGSFMRSCELYVEDHFMLRDSMIGLNTAGQLLLGKRDLAANYSSDPAEGGLYFGKNGHLYEVLLPDRAGIFQDNASALSEFARRVELPMAILPVPSGSQEQPENLPYAAVNHNQREEFEELEQAVGKYAKVLDVFSGLSLKTGQDYYFKTDHHWNTFGAYVGYRALAEAMSIPNIPQSDFYFKAAAQPFYGTLFSKIVDLWQQPDVLVLPYCKTGSELLQQTGETIHQGIYWDEYLTKKDKYSVYLGGNPPVTVIRNPDAPKGKLLLIKDSFANSMIPYLSQDFSEIHMIDLRYYNMDIYKYIKQNGIDRVAAVYSIKQLCDVSIANKLRR